jgi:cobalt-precorrin 5A hydrolase
MGCGEAMIVAGIGFRTSCPAEEIATLVRQAEDAAGAAAEALAVPAFKAGAPQAQEAAAALGLPLVTIDDAALAAVQPDCLTSSAAAQSAVGFASVAEGCALAAAGSGARLLTPRLASAAATCALAVGDPR